MQKIQALSFIIITFLIVSCSIIEPHTNIINDTIFIGSYDNSFYALNAKSGEKKWEYKTNEKFRNSCTIQDNYVYFYQDAAIIALDVLTGKKIWEYSVAAYDPIAAPTIYNNILYTNGNYSIIGLDLKTGRLVRQIKEIEVYGSIVINNGILYGNTRATVFAYDLAKDKKKWEKSIIDFGNFFTPVAYSDNSIFVGGSYDYMYSLNAETGEIQWKYKTGSDIQSSPTIYNSTVYFGSDDSNLYALDSKTGELKWKYGTKIDIRSCPIVANDLLYLTGIDGIIYCFNPNSGTLKWSKQLSLQIYSSPVIANGFVYFGCKDNKVYCFNSSNGKKIWEFETGDDIWASPSVIDDNKAVFYSGISGMIN